MKLSKIFMTTALASLTTLVPFSVHAATDTADAIVTVEAAIAITQQADLDFGTVVQGDAAGTVAPGDATAAEFLVTGQPSTAYTITLPANSTVVMTTGAGDTAQRQIAVDDFTSNPAAGANGALDGSGEQTLRVGATHAAIAADQETGSYSATFTVEVVY